MVHSVNKKFRQKAWITACSDLHMSRLFNTGSARFQNFECDNTTAGEDVHCFRSKEYLSKNIFYLSFNISRNRQDERLVSLVTGNDITSAFARSSLGEGPHSIFRPKACGTNNFGYSTA